MPATRRKRASAPAPTFRRSANVELDIANQSDVDYVVTACARRTLERILKGTSRESANRSWTITGPYGAGKSSFGLFLASVLCSRSMPTHGRMITALRACAADLENDISRALRGTQGFLPIVVSGSRESLTISLLRAAKAAITNCRGTRSKVVQKLIDSSMKKQGRVDVLEILTAVHACATSSECGFSGTLLLIDELGKLLEYAATQPSMTDVHVLQRLAEFAARTPVPMLVVGILHQDFSGYARDLPPVDRAEWEKIRGRFEDIAFDEPVDETLRLVARTWVASNDQQHARDTKWQSLCEVAARLGLSPRSMSHKEAVQLLSECWPLHPITSLILGPVFKRFGQNERSAFSFLQSHEPFGLLDFFARKSSSGGPLFTPSHLYDYLVGSIGDALLANRDGKRWAEALDLDRRLAQCNSTERDVFKTVALLGIVGRWHDVVPTAEIIRYALAPHRSENDVAHAIEALCRRSAITLRRYNGSYSLWEGSDVDVESRMSAAKSALPSDSATATLLQRHFRSRPMIARRHSFRSGTLRFFAVEYVTRDGLCERLSSPNGPSDGRILVLLEGNSTRINVREVVTTTKGWKGRVIVIPQNSREVTFLAQELACLEWVKTNTPELDGDSTAKREIAARTADIIRRLQAELSRCMVGQDGETPAGGWYHDGKKLRIENHRQLNEALSAVLDALFVDAPVINNEIINRAELSSSAAAARRNLMARMVTHANEVELGITGNPPERSIYLSVLRELGFHIKGTGWHFTTDQRSAKKQAGPLFALLRRFFEEAEQQQRSIADLFAQLQAPPYGLRLGVVPIIVCAALIAHESDVAVYEDGVFIPQLTVPIIERLIKCPQTFSLRRWRVIGLRAAVFHHLADMLGQESLTDRIGRNEILGVVKPLLRFVRKLDSYTLNTVTLRPKTVAVRDALVRATEPDQLLFVDLPNACGVGPFDSKRRSNPVAVRDYLHALRTAISEMQGAFEQLLAALQSSIAEAFGCTGDLAKIRMVLEHRCNVIVDVALDPDLRVLVSRIIDQVPDDRQWLESIAALLATRPPSNWRDDDRAKFDVALGQRARRIKALETLMAERRRAGSGTLELESIRLGIAGTGLSDRDTVVHLPITEIKFADSLAGSILSHLKGHASNGHRSIALAAIAMAAHRLLLEEQEHTVPEQIGALA